MQASRVRPIETRSLRTMRPATVAKVAGALAVGAGLMAFAYYVMPHLTASGPIAYALAFLIYGVTSASIVVPVPGMAALIVMANDLNPWALAAVAACGGALGELFGYWLGAQGGSRLTNSVALRAVKTKLERFGGPIVFLFAAVPILPMDAAAIAAGVLRYPMVRFLLYMVAGKALLLATVFMLASKGAELWRFWS